MADLALKPSPSDILYQPAGNHAAANAVDDGLPIAPGQLWLIRLPCASWALSPSEAQALLAANVIVYDAVLAPLVAALLPLGGYAESAKETGGGAADGFERACRFALDGWSVVRLVVEDAPCGAPGRVAGFVNRLLARGVRRELPAILTTDCGLGPELTRTQLNTLPAIVAELGPGKPLTIVFDPLGSGAAPHLYAVAANGLAG